LISELEFFLANAFQLERSALLPASIADVNRIVKMRRRRTLGQQLNVIEKQWIIKRRVRHALNCLLRARNTLAHGLVTRPPYRLSTKRGRENLERYLKRLLGYVAVVRESLAGAYFLSRLLVLDMRGQLKGGYRTTPRERRAILNYYDTFQPRI
jgi:hypothetical protein